MEMKAYCRGRGGPYYDPENDYGPYYIRDTGVNPDVSHSETRSF